MTLHQRYARDISCQIIVLVLNFHNLGVQILVGLELNNLKSLWWVMSNSVNFFVWNLYFYVLEVWDVSHEFKLHLRSRRCGGWTILHVRHAVEAPNCSHWFWASTPFWYWLVPFTRCIVCLLNINVFSNASTRIHIYNCSSQIIIMSKHGTLKQKRFSKFKLLIHLYSIWVLDKRRIYRKHQVHIFYKNRIRAAWFAKICFKLLMLFIEIAYPGS